MMSAVYAYIILSKFIILAMDIIIFLANYTNFLKINNDNNKESTIKFSISDHD